MSASRTRHDICCRLLSQLSLQYNGAANGWTYEVIQDLGSGLNYGKQDLRQLIQRICSGQVGWLVLTHKDRLLRFGSELVFALCEAYNTEVVLINQGEQPLSFEEPGTVDYRELRGNLRLWRGCKTG